MTSGAAHPGESGAGCGARLFDDGLVIHDDFLTGRRIRDLIECATSRRARGEFAAAHIGADAQRVRNAEIRGDSTCWLAEPLLTPERELLVDFEQLRLRLNRDAFLGLFGLELHYAHYPPGSGYARHVDQLRGREQRIVSLILYLNESWPPDAGGQLRFFGPDGGHRDVEPIAGRLVYFLSEERAHAVLPTRRDRLSVTGWFRARA